jgi:Signal peptidase, peptidase S26
MVSVKPIANTHQVIIAQTLRPRTSVALALLSLLVSCQSGCFRKEESADNLVKERTNTGYIASGSMEPALPGPGRRAECRNCPRSFRLSNSSIDESRPVYCPVCGQEAVLLEQVSEPGQIAYQSLSANDPIPRESLVVFEHEGRKEVKRVVGLPGESIAIRDGDLWIGENRVQKSFDEFLRQAILVNVLYSNDTVSHWSDGPNGWSIYGHRSVWPKRSLKIEMHEEPINDESHFNQGESKTLVAVQDIGVVLCWGSLSETSKIETAIRWRENVLGIEALRDGNRFKLRFLNGADQALFIDTSDDKDGWIAFTIADSALWMGTQTQQVCLCSDLTKTVLTTNDQLDVRLADHMLLAIRVASAQPVMRVVIRDIHRRGANDQLTQTLSVDEANYTVLGDNDAISDDSRTRLDKGIVRTQIAGLIPPSQDRLSSVKRQVQDIGATWSSR